MTRICTKCLEQSTPWIKFDFVCRRLKCETRLVPSKIAERKRFCTFGSSPLNLLPEDGLVAIVDFLSGGDLRRLFTTCSAMCMVSERIAKRRVEGVHEEFHSGPLLVETRKNVLGGNPVPWIHAAGENEFPLRAPEDCKAWNGICYYLEEMVKESFYFGFQMRGTGAETVVTRFLQKRDKFVFGQDVYSEVGENLKMCNEVHGISVKGGQILVTENFNHELGQSTLTFSSDEALITGTHRFIYRIFCPDFLISRGTRLVLGGVGLLRTNHQGEGPSVGWAQKTAISGGRQREDIIVGLEYNADTRTFVTHTVGSARDPRRFTSTRHTLADTPGDITFGVELTSIAGIKHTLLSVRKCDGVEWSAFMSHIPEGGAELRPRAEANDDQVVELNVNFGGDVDDDNAVDEGHEEPPFRAVFRNRRHEARRRNNNDDVGNNSERVRADQNADGAVAGIRRGMDAFQAQVNRANENVQEQVARIAAAPAAEVQRRPEGNAFFLSHQERMAARRAVLLEHVMNQRQRYAATVRRVNWEERMRDDRSIHDSDEEAELLFEL